MPGTTSWLNVDADLSDAAEALGHIDGALREIESNYWAASIVEYTHAVSARQFNRDMDAIARSTPKKFHHVYEWGMVGVPGGQLWKHNLLGNGMSGMRTATFTFALSKVPVPQPKSGTAGGSGNLSDKRYIFGAKAAVMESGTPVHIVPRTGKLILIPNAELAESDKEFIFAKEANVPNPGGDVAGNFSGAWATWWSGPGHAIFDEFVRTRLETRLKSVVSPRSSKSSTTIHKGKMNARMVSLSASAAATAMAEVQKLATEYKRQALALEKEVNRGR